MTEDQRAVLPARRLGALALTGLGLLPVLAAVTLDEGRFAGEERYVALLLALVPALLAAAYTTVRWTAPTRGVALALGGLLIAGAVLCVLGIGALMFLASVAGDGTTVGGTSTQFLAAIGATHLYLGLFALGGTHWLLRRPSTALLYDVAR